jgi:hypothetical protein
MIATKIILTNSVNQFEDLMEGIMFFLGSSDSTQLLANTTELVTNNWIENTQNFELVNPNTINIINYSENAEKSQLFANELAWLNGRLPADTTLTIEQYSVEAIPSTATPILVDGDFYLNNNTIDT